MSFLKDLKIKSPFKINPDLNYLGSEASFSFAAKVMEVEKSKKFAKIYKFHVGDTGPKTPAPIIEVAIQALKDKQTKYGHFMGYPQVRKNLAQYLSETRKTKIEAENIILLPGGKPVIELTMQALLGPGDYVVGQSPAYPIYELLARFYGKNKFIPWKAVWNEKNKQLDFKIEDLEKIFKKNKKIKLLVINTPQNPTGLVLSKEKIGAIAKLVKKYKCMVLFDDIYDQIIFGGQEHLSILSIPGMLDYTINLGGYSKDYAMTGWRLGYAVAPAWLIKIFGQLAVNKWSGVSRVNQIVAGAMYGDVELDGFVYKSIADKLPPFVKQDVLEYEKKGKFVVEQLCQLEPYVIAGGVQGAFYIFPNIKKVLELSYVKKELKIKDDKQFVEWLLNEKGFACLPGSDFGEAGKGFVRLSYAEDWEAQIVPGIKYFVEIIKELIEKSKV